VALRHEDRSRRPHVACTGVAPAGARVNGGFQAALSWEKGTTVQFPE